MKIQESGEMYLETLLILSKKSSFVRAIDIAEEMNFSKPSVSRGLAILKKEGYIEVAPSGAITFTQIGKDLAEKIYERHQTLTAYFKALGVDEENANNDACRIEHIISDETFNAIKKCLESF